MDAIEEIRAKLATYPGARISPRVHVAGVFGLAMVVLGRLSLAEAGACALYSEHPTHWLTPPDTVLQQRTGEWREPIGLGMIPWYVSVPAAGGPGR